MKKGKTHIILLLLLSNFCYSQIKVLNTAEITKEKIITKPEEYKGKQNFNQEDLSDKNERKKYIGIECFFGPKEVLEKTYFTIYQKKPILKNNRYKYNLANKDLSFIEKISNKKVTIKGFPSYKEYNNIISKSKDSIINLGYRKDSNIREPYERTNLIELELIETNETYYLSYANNNTIKILITVPFFEKIQSYKKFVVSEFGEVENLETEENIIAQKNSIWELQNINYVKNY